LHAIFLCRSPAKLCLTDCVPLFTAIFYLTKEQLLWYKKFIESAKSRARQMQEAYAIVADSFVLERKISIELLEEAVDVNSPEIVLNKNNCNILKTSIL